MLPLGRTNVTQWGFAVSLIYQIWQKLPCYIRKRATAHFYWWLMKNKEQTFLSILQGWRSIAWGSIHATDLGRITKHQCWYTALYSCIPACVERLQKQIYYNRALPPASQPLYCPCICYHRKKTRQEQLKFTRCLWRLLPLYAALNTTFSLPMNLLPARSSFF